MAFLLISSVGVSALLSYLLLAEEIPNEVIREFLFEFDPVFIDSGLSIRLLVDKSASIMLSLFSTIIIVVRD